MVTKIDLKVVVFAIISLAGLFLYIFKPPIFPKPPTTPSFCGGIANIQCPKGYKCQLKAIYPDAGGSCIKK